MITHDDGVASTAPHTRIASAITMVPGTIGRIVPTTPSTQQAATSATPHSGMPPE